MSLNYITPFGSFQLLRLPVRTNEFLQAFDASDQILLEYLHQNIQFRPLDKIAILNDSFGALSIPLASKHPFIVSDSYLSKTSVFDNCVRNEIPTDSISFLSSLDSIDCTLDFVFLKVPKTLALLEYQLHQLRPNVRPNTVFIAYGMMKNLSNSVWKIIESHMGATSTSLAVKKAKLIHVQPAETIKVPENPYPSTYPISEKGWTLSNHANVFSREKFDIGTRFLLSLLNPSVMAKDCVDLGCGNGLVGLYLAELCPQSHITFVDESYMAVDSAKTNFESVYGQSNRATFTVNDGLDGFEPDSVDCIVCNPPFHQSHVMGDFLAKQMFYQAKATLRAGGEFWVVGNRHLNYQQILKTLFKQCEWVGRNQKFNVMRCYK